MEEEETSTQMKLDTPLYEIEKEADAADPDETPIKDRKIITQPYDLVVESLIDQIKNGTLFLRPISERPAFQRKYVWSNKLASRLIESILLNVPIPPCYLSQNDEYELDVIDGQQRLYSIYRFIDNRFKLTNLEILTELNGLQFHELPPTIQRQFKTHTLRLIAITNQSHAEIKFDVFQRLNTNTMPLNAQELRNCIYRGSLNDLLKDAVQYEPWLNIISRKEPDKRMRDEELVLRFFAFSIHGVDNYRTPQKHWLNDAAKAGQKYSEEKVRELKSIWEKAIDISLMWFEPSECFRREISKRSKAINRALFDLTMLSAARVNRDVAIRKREAFRKQYFTILDDSTFNDLISRAVDHKSRTISRHRMWDERVNQALR